MIYAFDVDGTLTEPRQKIDRDFLVLMVRLLSMLMVAMHCTVLAKVL